MKNFKIGIFVLCIALVLSVTLAACHSENEPLASDVVQTTEPSTTQAEQEPTDTEQKPSESTAQMGSMESSQPWETMSEEYPFIISDVPFYLEEGTGAVYLWDIENAAVMPTQEQHTLSPSDQTVMFDGQQVQAQDTKDFPIYAAKNLRYYYGDIVKVIWTDAAGVENVFDIDLKDVPIPEALSEMGVVEPWACRSVAKEGNCFLLFFANTYENGAFFHCLRYDPQMPENSTWAGCPVDESYSSEVLTAFGMERCCYVGGKLYIAMTSGIMVYNVADNELYPLMQPFSDTMALYPMHTQNSLGGYVNHLDAAGRWGDKAIFRVLLTPWDASEEVATFYDVLFAVDSNTDELVGVLAMGGDVTVGKRGVEKMQPLHITAYDRNLEIVGTPLTLEDGGVTMLPAAQQDE